MLLRNKDFQILDIQLSVLAGGMAERGGVICSVQSPSVQGYKAGRAGFPSKPFFRDGAELLPGNHHVCHHSSPARGTENAHPAKVVSILTRF